MSTESGKRDEIHSLAEKRRQAREQMLLPEETLENLIEHFLRVKDGYPGYDAKNPQDIAGYVAERLADLAITKFTSEQYRKLNFCSGVLGRLFDIPQQRPTTSYGHFKTYDEKGIQTGNQVDYFLTRIGHLPEKS